MEDKFSSITYDICAACGAAVDGGGLCSYDCVRDGETNRKDNKKMTFVRADQAAKDIDDALDNEVFNRFSEEALGKLRTDLEKIITKLNEAE